eukprot:COSAG05_NODE_1358_length_5103_cov_18.985811_4_plen_108_part_00
MSVSVCVPVGVGVPLALLWCHQVVAAVYAKLNSRPRTFTHGDMRTENTFRSKSDKTCFRTVDWQTCTACSPGVEFIQLFSGWMQRSCYEKDTLDSIYDTYLVRESAL